MIGEAEPVIGEAADAASDPPVVEVSAEDAASVEQVVAEAMEAVVAVEAREASAQPPADPPPAAEAVEAAEPVDTTDDAQAALEVAAESADADETEYGPHAALYERVLDALYGNGDTSSGGAAARELARGNGKDREAARSDLCVATLWRLSRGETAGAAQAIERLRRAPGDSPQSVTTNTVCATLLEAKAAGSGPAVDRLMASPVKEVAVTNTIAIPRERWFDRLKVLSIAGLLSKAIGYTHSDQSVSSLFD